MAKSFKLPRDFRQYRACAYLFNGFNHYWALVSATEWHYSKQSAHWEAVRRYSEWVGAHASRVNVEPIDMKGMMDRAYFLYEVKVGAERTGEARDELYEIDWRCREPQ